MIGCPGGDDIKRGAVNKGGEEEIAEEEELRWEK